MSADLRRKAEACVEAWRVHPMRKAGDIRLLKQMVGDFAASVTADLRAALAAADEDADRLAAALLTASQEATEDGGFRCGVCYWIDKHAPDCEAAAALAAHEEAHRAP